MHQCAVEEEIVQDELRRFSKWWCKGKEKLWDDWWWMIDIESLQWGWFRQWFVDKAGLLNHHQKRSCNSLLHIVILMKCCCRWQKQTLCRGERQTVCAQRGKHWKVDCFIKRLFIGTDLGEKLCKMLSAKSIPKGLKAEKCERGMAGKIPLYTTFPSKIKYRMPSRKPKRPCTSSWLFPTPGMS